MTHPILHDIDAFLRRTNLSETYFGRQAANDWKLISQLRKGRRLWPQTEQRIRDFMASYRPRGERSASVAGAANHG